MGLIHNPAVYPPDGFYFLQDGTIRIQGASMPKLAIAVRDYRISHGLPVGNPLLEVNDFTCARYPSGCRDLNPKYDMPDPKKQVTVPGSIGITTNKWLTDLYRALSSASGSLRVGQAEADRRAAICAGCPKQLFWGTGCGGCDAASKRLAFNIRNGKEAAGGDKLMACGVLREDTRTSVWIDGLKPAENGNLPATCWRRASA